MVTVCGEADLDSKGALSDAVDRALRHYPHQVVDLDGVAFADSTFLTVLLQARRIALGPGGGTSS